MLTKENIYCIEELIKLNEKKILELSKKIMPIERVNSLISDSGVSSQYKEKIRSFMSNSFCLSDLLTLRSQIVDLEEIISDLRKQLKNQ